MSKRRITVQNNGNEQQPTSSSIVTRSQLKRSNVDESAPVKHKKIDENKHVDKENVPKRRSAKTKARAPTPPPVPDKIIEPPVDDNSSASDDSDDDEDYEETYEEEMVKLPKNDPGKRHPRNEHYLIYENAGPNQQPLIVSKTARYLSANYCKIIPNVYPDRFGMYIHADFSCYGELEIVENCLLDLTKALFITQQNASKSKVKSNDQVNYILGFRRLEALTILLEHTDGIGGIDDGDRFYAIMRVIGACYVTILRGLLPEAMFKTFQSYDKSLLLKLKRISKQIPNFKQVLEQALIIGHLYLSIGDVCSAYTKILQIVYCNWVFVTENVSVNFNDKRNEKLSEALRHASAIDPNGLDYGDKELFDYLKELRIYKGQYGLGGDSYDISKWSKGEREDYKFGNFSFF